MGVQTATTGQLDSAQNIIIAKSRFTAEYNAPCWNLIESFTLAQGQKQITVPKVGQMSMSRLTDGVDLVDSEDIGMTTVDLTTSEVGAKVILTDKLLRQESESVFNMIGVQLGDGMGRFRNRDVISLFTGLNGGTALGLDDADLTLHMATGVVTHALANKFPKPVFVVHHPNAIANLSKSAMSIGAGAGVTQVSYYTGILQGLSEQLLRDFWSLRINGINFFQTGDIDKDGSVDSGYGAIFSQHAMCHIESQAPTTERERDASLRAWELVIVSDYGVFELDDTYGAPMLYEIGALSTTST